MCTEGGIDVLGETAHHTFHVLHPVPAGDLQDERRLGRSSRSRLEQIGVAVDSAGRSVTTRERHSRHGSVAVEQAHVAEDDTGISM